MTTWRCPIFALPSAVISAYQRAVCTAAALLLILPATSAIAQTLQGTVKNGDSGAPIVDASVVLLDEDGTIQRGTLTEPDGSFIITAPSEGTYTLRVGAAGFEVQNTPPLRIEESGEFQVDLLLQSENREAGPPIGFRQRMAAGEGIFITREQIEERAYSRFTDVFQFTPAVKVIAMPISDRMNSATSTPAVMSNFSRRAEALLGGVNQYMTLRVKAGRDFNSMNVGATQQGERANDCAPVLWVDGIWWGNIDRASADGPDAAFAPGDIEAIEIFNHPSILPAQFDSGRDSLCGVVVVWRKRTEEN